MRDGQFFTLSLIILSGIILGAVAVTNSVSSTFDSSSLAQSIVEQTDVELGYSIGASAEQGDGVQGQLLAARAFSDFREYVEQQRGIDTTSIYVVGTPIDTGVNVSVTNLRGSPLEDAWITLDGTARPLGTLGDGDSNITTFTTTADSITAKINGTGVSNTFTTPRKTFVFLDSSSRFGSSVFSDTALY